MAEQAARRLIGTLAWSIRVHWNAVEPRYAAMLALCHAHYPTE